MSNPINNGQALQAAFCHASSRWGETQRPFWIYNVYAVKAGVLGQLEDGASRL